MLNFAPIRDPFSMAGEPITSAAWQAWFTELQRQYDQVWRWTDPTHPDYGKVEPPENVRRRGLLAYADGVAWNPGGSGEGHYWYNGSGWTKL